MDEISKEIIKGSFWGGFAKFLNKAGALVFSVILARFLFPETFGLYTLTMSIAGIFMAFADLGLSNVLIRCVSSNWKNKKKTAAYFQYILKLKVMVSIVVSFALLIFAYPLSFWIYHKPEIFLPLVMASIFIFTFLFTSFFSSFFYVVKKVKFIGVNEVVFQVVRMFFVVFVFVFLTSTYYMFGIFVGLILTNLVSLIFLIILIYKFFPDLFKKSKELIDKKRVFSFFIFTSIATISGLIHNNVDNIVLGFFVPLTFIGFFQIAFTLAFGITGFFSYLSLIFLPIFTNMKNREISLLFNRVLKIILVFSIPVLVGILLFGKYFIILLYGKSYLQATYPLYILSFMIVTYIPAVMMGAIFLSKEKPKPVAKAVICAIILNIILNYVLISNLVKISNTWAIIGAGIATIVSKFFVFICLVVLMKKEFNISLRKDSFIKPIFAGIIMYTLIRILMMLSEINLFTYLVLAIIGTSIYFMIIFLIGGIPSWERLLDFLKR